MLAGIPAIAGTTESARVLADLSVAPEHAAARIKASPKDVSDLTLDLIVYRWACKASHSTTTDLKNLDQVIAACATGLNDPLINWSLGAFSMSVTAKPTATPEPAGDPRVALLIELKRQFGMALEFRDSSPIQSVNSLTIVLDTCQKQPLDLTGALVRKLLGNQYHYDMARYRQADDCYGYAGQMFSYYDCAESAAAVYHDYGVLCGDMARYSAATVNYTLAARQWATLAKQNPTVSRYRAMAGREFILAGLAQNQAGDRGNAVQLMDYGIDHLGAAAEMTKSYRELIANLITVALLYTQQNDLPKAKELLDYALKASQHNNDFLLAAQVHQELHTVYKAMNLPLRAFQELDTRDKILEQAAQAGQTALAKVTSPTANALPRPSQTTLLLTAEQGAQALQQLKRNPESAQLLQKTLDAYGRSAMVDEQMRCLRSLAAVMDIDNKPQDSLAARMQAATLAIKANKKVVAAEIVREMVQEFIAIGDLNSALDTLTELWPIIEQSGNVRGAADVLDGRGTLLASHGRNEDAVKDFQDALTRYSTQVGDPWAAGKVCQKLALALEALGKRSDACAALESSLKEIENRYADEDVDPSLNAERSGLMMSLYKELVTAYVRDGKIDVATALVTRARRYPWVADLVSQLKASADATVADFAKNVDIVHSPSDPGTVGAPSGKPTLLASDWAGFFAKSQMLAEQHAARYNALPIQPMELYKSRNDLPKKVLVVEFLSTESSTYAFVCGNGKSFLWELGVSRKEISSFATGLRKSMKNCEDSLSAGVPLPRINDWREPTFLEVRNPLVSLYTKLIAPISDSLTGYQILMFALPEELDGVPMHALITSEKDGVPRFLVQDFEVGYLSTGMLGDLISRDSRPIDPTSDRLAIFADPAGNLPGAREEASMLENLYFTSVKYTDKHATVNNFIKECDKASILHIAVHYKIDPNPSKFVLQLAPEGDSDGSITVQELSAITNPHLQMVVLSACESAASADPLQSGPSCAAKVFSLAFAKSVLGGLWKVSDDSASKLMGDFYRSLAKGVTRTGSLQKAQVAMIKNKEFAHPFYWACFALYGNPW